MMTKYFVAFATIIIFLNVGCSSSMPNDNIEQEKNEVAPIIDEVVQDDFIFRLVSEKEQYNEGEEVKLYGEIEYIGNKEEVTIRHSSSAILFPMKEEIRGYEIGGFVNTIGLSTTLKKGESYREDYTKSGGYSLSQDPEDYVNFIKDFLNRKDFPPGHYVVNGFTDFSVNSGENGEKRERFNIKAKIEFKVVD
jgi:hypothetical protein